MAVKLGSIVTDNITGFSGVAMSRIEYLNGCVRVEVQPKALHEGKPISSEFFDEQRLDAKSEVKTGGPQGKEPPRS